MNSGKMTTIARPYVTAAFEYALASKQLAEWEMMLQNAAAITADAGMAQLLSNPEITTAQLADLYIGVLGKQINAHQKNFIQLLAENERLTVLPDIAALFKKQRAAQEKIMEVQVISAALLEEDYKQKLIRVLSKRLDRDVKLQCEVNPNLLGGVIVRAGDMVIDGSIRGKLTRLSEFI